MDREHLRTPLGTAAAVALVCLLYIVVGAIVNYRKLRQFRGPPLAAYTSFWLFWEECNARLPQSQQAALRKYGSPARLAPNLLVTDDSDLIRHINAPGSQWSRASWYDAMKLDPRQNSVFSTRDEKLHAALKAKESTGYNGRDIPALEDDIDERISELLDLIQSEYHAQSMDFAHVARYFTLDVLSTVAFGKSFGFMAANEDLYDYNKISASFMMILGLQCNHPSVHGFMSQWWVQALAAPRVTDKKGWGPILAFARKAVAERYVPGAKSKRDMLGSFMDRGLSQTEVEVEAFLQIMAGSDSTSSVLRSVVYLLSASPPAYVRLQAEVDAAVVTHGLRPGRVIRYTDVLKLPYLKACLLEALRLFPPLFGLKTKAAPPGGDTFKGVFYPHGSEVCFCDDACMRRPAVFGDDPAVFRPERFLEGDEELQTRRFRAVEVAFGSGRFMCLGRHIAQMELYKVVFQLFRTFDFQIADPTRGIDLTYHNVHIASNMNLVARRRRPR